MAAFVLRKFTRILAVLVGAALLMFLLIHALPGNPWGNYSTGARAMVNEFVDSSIRRQLNDHFGLELPLWRQFTRYLALDIDPDGSIHCGALCGNLGPSTQQKGRLVQDILFAAPEGKTSWDSSFGYSIRLVLLGALIAVGLGLPLGILSAAKPNSAGSRAVTIVLAALLSVPNFVLGLLAIIVLASWLKLINVIPDWHNPVNWLLAGLVLALMPMASVARVTRAALLNIVKEDYIRAARAKGLTAARLMLVHVLRNALAPIITFLGPTLVELFTGLFVVESLYSFPGFGRGYWGAILALDYPMVMGLTLVYAAGFALVSMVIDILCGVIDPRIRSAQQPGGRG
jgi:oligopeptide transport system permease protein